MNQKLVAQDVMQPFILECHPSETLKSAILKMSEHSSTSILVVQNGQAIGIWTERDVLDFSFSDSDAATVPISKVMRSPVRVISGTTILDEVIIAFNRLKTRNFLVVGPGGSRLGIVTQTDVVLTHDLSHALCMRWVNEIVSPAPSIPVNASLAEAADLMRKYHTDAIVVLSAVDVFSGLVGILSQRDLVRALGSRSDDCLIGEIIHPSMKTIYKDETIFNARNTMIKNGFRHLGVADRSGRFVGILHFSDVLKCVQDIYFEGLKEILDARSKALQTTKKHLALAEKIIEFAMDGILVTSEEGIIQSVNPAFTEMMGFTPEEIIGKTPSIMKSGRHDDVFYAVMRRTLKSVGYWQGEIWNRDKDGIVHPQLLAISKIPDEAGETYCYSAVYRDISKLKESEAEVKKLAFFDTLTGLPNRRALEIRLEKKLATSVRRGKYGALLYIDLDHFKPVNDSLGHAVGDLALVKVADRLSEILREEDMAGRYGGDEFLILLADLGGEMKTAVGFAKTVAEKVERRLNDAYLIEGQQLSLGASIGISMFPDQQSHYKEILEQADTAMYRAKKSANQKVHFFDQNRQVSASGHATKTEALREGFEAGQLCLHYETQVDDSGAIKAVASLLRWMHPERGMISPAEIFSEIESSAIAASIGFWYLRESSRQLKSWLDAEIPATHLSLNIPAPLFLQDDFVSRVEQIFLETSVDPRLLTFEIADGVAFKNHEVAAKKMKDLKGIGIQWTLANFGNGQISLSALQRLPFNKIKIDDQSVHELNGHADSRVMVQAIIGIAQAMQLEVFAEGVQTKAQLKLLKEMACRFFQGPLLSQILPATEMGARLASELNDR